MEQFEYDGFYFRRNNPKYNWEVYWPGSGWIAIDGDTKEEISNSWVKSRVEINNQLRGEY